MESNLIRRNEQLPPELLAIIFAHFGHSETFDHSLEHLLLVCRSWTRAALDHRSLWGHINVTIQHQETFQRCMARVKSRMQRSISSAPLEIEITIDLDKDGLDPKCTRSNWDFGTSRPNCCYHRALHLMSELFDAISGQDGIHCERWRSLSLGFPSERPRFNLGEAMPLWRSLGYPTPMLSSLTIYYAEWLKTILPSCPSLKYLRLFATNLSSVSDVRSVQNMIVTWFGEEPLDLSDLCTAASLMELTLDFEGDGFYFPIILTSLTHLIIKELDVPEYLPLPDIPNLKVLTLKCSDFNSMRTMAEWSNLPYKSMICVEIVLESTWVVLEFRVSLFAFLALMSAQTRIVVNTFVLDMIIKVMWDVKSQQTGGSYPTLSGHAFPFHGKPFELHHRDMNANVPFSGTESGDELLEIAKQQDLFPSETWEEFVKHYGAPESKDIPLV